MLCPNCGKPTEEDKMILCPKCQEVKDEADKEAKAKFLAEQERFKPRAKRDGIEDPETGSKAQPQHEPAGFWLRSISYSFDQMITTFFMILISIPLFLIFSPETKAENLSGTATLAFYLVSFLITGIYYTLTESSNWQATIGKKLLGLKVTTTDGQTASLGQCANRSVIKIISTIFMGLPFIAIALNPNKQGLHDTISSTLVVKTEKTTWVRIILVTFLSWVLPLIFAIVIITSLMFGSMATNVLGGNDFATPSQSNSIEEGYMENDYSSNDAPQLGSYSIERYKNIRLKLNSTDPLMISYSHPKTFDNSKCKDSCAKISILDATGKSINDWIGTGKAGAANPTDGTISLEIQNLTDRQLDVILHGEMP